MLYQYTPDGYRVHLLKQTKWCNGRRLFQLSFTEGIQMAQIIYSFVNVKVSHTSIGIWILCTFDNNIHTSKSPISLQNNNIYNCLPFMLQCICRKVHLPQDGGKKLIEYLIQHNKPLIGVSDASLKTGHCGHAWILSTGELDHINNPIMYISGRGMVDGYHADLSSACGEL